VIHTERPQSRDWRLLSPVLTSSDPLRLNITGNAQPIFGAFKSQFSQCLVYYGGASSPDQWTPVTVAIAALGFLTAVANSISARGSKFWQQNWEHHIDMLEDAIEGRLHKMVWLHDGKVSFSVSRVNFALSDCIVGFWLLVAVYVAWKYLGAPPLGWPAYDPRKAYVSFVAVLVGLGLWRIWRSTDLRGTLPDAEGHHGHPWRPSWSWRFRTVAEPRTFIRRYAPDEGP